MDGKARMTTALNNLIKNFIPQGLVALTLPPSLKAKARRLGLRLELNAAFFDVVRGDDVVHTASSTWKMRAARSTFSLSPA